MLLFSSLFITVFLICPSVKAKIAKEKRVEMEEWDVARQRDKKSKIDPGIKESVGQE